MIENATINRLNLEVAPGDEVELEQQTYNFPSTSQAELTVRVKHNAHSTIHITTQLLLTFGIGNPPDFGLGTSNQQTLQYGELEANEDEEWSPWTPPATIVRAFDAIRIQPLLNTLQPRISFQARITVYRPEDVGPTYTQPANFGGR